MTAARVRLDAELVRRGLARSREQAGELVAAGRVTVGGEVFASRPPLKRCFGSGRLAPLKKLTFTLSLNAPSAHTLPLELKTGMPHFHSSFRSGDAELMVFVALPD